MEYTSWTWVFYSTRNICIQFVLCRLIQSLFSTFVSESHKRKFTLCYCCCHPKIKIYLALDNSSKYGHITLKFFGRYLEVYHLYKPQCLSVGLSVCPKKMSEFWVNVVLLLLRTPSPPLPSSPLPSPPLASPPLPPNKLTINLTAASGGGLHSLYFNYTTAPLRASCPINYILGQILLS